MTRLINVEFKNPDIDTRKKIWNVHIRSANDGQLHRLNIPLADDVDTTILAEKYDFVGREIRNAVISACINVALAERDIVTLDDFIKSCDKIVREKESIAKAKDHTISDKSKDIIKNAIIEKNSKQQNIV